MMSRQDAAHAMRVLRSAQTSVKALVVMESFVPAARTGMMAQVAALEAADDIAEISLAAHEIRGLAEPAGLRAAGRITDVLCRYLDEAQVQGRAVDKSVVQLHVSAILRACIDKLSPAHREIINLVYYHEKSVEEAGEIIGIPQSTVKTRMFYARKQLAELLKGAGVGTLAA